MNARPHAVCFVLASMTSASAASAQDARPPVARFADEKPETHAATRLGVAADVRTEPNDAGQIVAHLARGAIVTRMATRGDFVLVSFDDPEGLLVTVSGWAPFFAFTPPPLAPIRAVALTGEPRRSWYGWQTLIADGAGVGLMVGSMVPLFEGRGATAVFLALGLGVATFGLGAPIVHWAHGNVGEGFGSLGMRLLAGGVGFLAIVVVAVAATGGGGPAALVVLPLGAAALILPPIIDAALLAYDEAPASKAQETRLVPTVTPNKNGATIGLAGSF